MVPPFPGDKSVFEETIAFYTTFVNLRGQMMKNHPAARVALLI
jgi:hypothetical protein